MVELTDTEIDAALERGRRAQQTEPRAMINETAGSLSI